LATHRIRCDDAALQRQHCQKLRHRRDLIGFGIGGNLAKQQPLINRPGMDHMERRLAGGAIERPPQGLAVDSDHAVEALREALHEANEAFLEWLGVKLAKHPTECVMTGDRVLEAQKLTQKGLFGPAKDFHVRAILATAQHGAEGDNQNLMEVVTDILLPRVGNLGEAGDELVHAGAPRLNPSVGIQSAGAPQV
jgi:hypothetical protein